MQRYGCSYLHWSRFIEDCLKLAVSSLLCPRPSTEVTEEVPIPAAVPRPGSPVLVGLQMEVGQVCRYAALASCVLVYPFRFLRWKNNWNTYFWLGFFQACHVFEHSCLSDVKAARRGEKGSKTKCVEDWLPRHFLVRGNCNFCAIVGQASLLENC